MSKVWKVAGFVLVAALVFRSGPEWSGAQDEPDPPVKLILGSGTPTIPTEDMVRLHARESKRFVIWDHSEFRNQKFTLTVPKGCMDVDVREVVSVALARAGQTIVRHGGFDEVVPAAKALAYSRTVTESELHACHATEHVRFVCRLAHLDAGAVRGVLANLATPLSGRILALHQPAGQRGRTAIDALVICDRAGNVRDLLKLVKMLDRPRKAEEPSDD